MNVRDELLSSGFVSSAPLFVAEVPGARLLAATVDAAVQPALLTLAWCCLDAKGNAISAYDVERLDLVTGISNLITVAAGPHFSSDLAVGRR